jgi:hypothetical protein
MILSYLALALATVLLLAGIVGTAFTFRTIAQRQAERGNMDTQTWHGIFAPMPAFQFDYLRIESERSDAGFSRLFYRVAYYLALGVAAIQNIAIALMHFKQ